MRPKVSIIIPCYNVEKYLDRCLNSVTNQTLKDIEIILVDDVSPDRVPEMCDEWAERDGRIKVIHKEKNEGLGYARNTGMDIVTGEYIAFLDSDDYVDLDMYSELYKMAKECDDLQAVFCGVNNVDDNGNVYSTHCDYDKTTIINSNEECRKIGIEIVASPDKTSRLKYIQSVWHGIYNSDFLKKHDLKFCSEREFISEDIIFDIDFMAVANHIGYVPKAFNYYCDNYSSLSKTFKTDRYDRFVLMWKEILRRYDWLGYAPIAKKCANKYILAHSRAMVYSYVKNIKSWRERYLLTKKIVNDSSVWKVVLTPELKEILPNSYFVFYCILKMKISIFAIIYAVIKVNCR